MIKMKKTIIFIALTVIVLALVSCKNNNKAKVLSPEEIQEQREALADSALAKIDAIAEEYIDASGKSFSAMDFELTNEEKLNKPDYLLDPSLAEEFITKSQKVNALAIYMVENAVREAYGMPVKAAQAAIAKLAVEVNYPIDKDKVTAKEPVSNRVADEYKACRDRGDIAYFWQFNYAIITEFEYLLAQNPELFFRHITEEEWEAFRTKGAAEKDAIHEMAQYDKEAKAIADAILQRLQQEDVFHSAQEYEAAIATKESAIQCFKDKKHTFVANRNSLLR